jgi:hypothetical protein
LLVNRGQRKHSELLIIELLAVHAAQSEMRARERGSARTLRAHLSSTSNSRKILREAELPMLKMMPMVWNSSMLMALLPSPSCTRARERESARARAHNVENRLASRMAPPLPRVPGARSKCANGARETAWLAHPSPR